MIFFALIVGTVFMLVDLWLLYRLMSGIFANYQKVFDKEPTSSAPVFRTNFTVSFLLQAFAKIFFAVTTIYSALIIGKLSAIYFFIGCLFGLIIFSVFVARKWFATGQISGPM